MDMSPNSQIVISILIKRHLESMGVIQFPCVSNKTFKLNGLADEILSVSNISLLLYLGVTHKKSEK